MKAKGLLALLAAGLSSVWLAACAALPGAPPDGHWTLSVVEAVDAEPVPIVGHAFTLQLDAEQRAAGRVACNRWHGRYRLEGQRLTLHDPVSTRARCLIEDESVARLERRYLEQLQSGARLNIEDERLVLQFGDGSRWHFRKLDNG